MEIAAAFGLRDSVVIANMADLLDFLVLMDYHTKREENILKLCRILIIKNNWHLRETLGVSCFVVPEDPRYHC